MKLSRITIVSFLLFFFVSSAQAQTDRLRDYNNQVSARYSTGKYIDINLSRQILTIFQGGVALDSYWISSGKKGHSTPIGVFKVYNKQRKAYSRKYKAYMPYWMAISPSGAYGIHELPINRRGRRGGVHLLGTPASHGCIRVGVGPAKRIYNWAEVGIPVYIHY